MRPAFLDEMSWRMAEVYASVTDRILINLAHYFPYVKDSGEVKGAFEYQARLLAKMGQVNSETAQIIASSLGGADDALRQSLEAAILDALKNEEPKLRKAAEQGLLHGPGFPVDQVSIFGQHDPLPRDALNQPDTQGALQGTDMRADGGLGQK